MKDQHISNTDNKKLFRSVIYSRAPETADPNTLKTCNASGMLKDLRDFFIDLVQGVCSSAGKNFGAAPRLVSPFETRMADYTSR
jgi:hypothetical protein